MNLANKTVREIALEMPATTRVFEELKIDYCCGGQKSLVEACEIAKVSPAAVEERIAKLSNVGFEPKIDLDNQTSPSKLVDSIVAKHHVFTREEITRLSPLMDKVAGKHGEKHPELLDLREAFKSLSDDLIPHLEKEEAVLFPFIKRLEASEITKNPAPVPPFGTVQNPIRMMGHEHETAGDLLRKMRSISGDYTAPEGACPSFKALYFGLEELEKDLHQHIHLENNILFPLAVDIERKLSETVD